MGETIYGRFQIPFEYAVTFTPRVFAPDNADFAAALSRHEARRHRAFFVVDDGVASALPDLVSDIERYAEAHRGALQLAAPPLVVPGGEACKNDPAFLGDVQRRIDELHIDRQSFVVAVGGGALLDMVGHAAAVAHRGIRHVRVPTTVLSQADSGVGVKNGVNAFGKKNFLGTFAPPFAVLVDTTFLSSLPRRHAIAGMAEAVKVALLKDAAFYRRIEEAADRLARRDEAETNALVHRCAELHLQHIAGSGDPFECGSARPLDFGHWSAHKLEALTRHELSHGEAVAIGMAIDTVYAALKELAPPEMARDLVRLLRRLGFDLSHPALDARSESGRRRVLDGIAEFREHLGGELTIILVPEPGRTIEVHELDLDAMDHAIAMVNDLRTP